MSKAAAKKAQARSNTDREKRKKPRGPSTRSRVSTAKKAKTETEACYNCSKSLKNEERALLVEEEVGRIYCSEECISEYFAPDIARLEKEYYKYLATNDLTPAEREKYSHLRWVTLEEPDEVWREKTLTGDYRYTLVSEFKPAGKPIWCVCICLFLRGEPSFLYLAFSTKNASMVAHYRKGERIQWTKASKKASQAMDKAASEQEPGQPSDGSGPLTDGLAEAWTEDELRRANANQSRKSSDIQEADFEHYQQGCMEQTLEDPHELWVANPEEEGAMKIYHFIRFFSEEDPGIWFVIVARETEDEEQIEILDAFPTRDSTMVDRYRQGAQEIGSPQNPTTSRLVH